MRQPGPRRHGGAISAITGQAHFEFLLRGRQLQRLPGLADGAAIDEHVRARGLGLHRDLAEDRFERKPHVATRTRGDGELVRGGLVAVAGRDDRQRHVRPHLERQRRATTERPADADVRAGGLRAHDQRAVGQAEPDRPEGLRLVRDHLQVRHPVLEPGLAQFDPVRARVELELRRRRPARLPVDEHLRARRFGQHRHGRPGGHELRLEHLSAVEADDVDRRGVGLVTRRRDHEFVAAGRQP